MSLCYILHILGEHDGIVMCGCYKIVYAARLEGKATLVVNVKCFLGTDSPFVWGVVVFVV